MKQSTATRLVFLLAFIVVIIAFSAFRQKGDGVQDTFRKEPSTQHDTTKPRKRPQVINDGDMEKLDAVMFRLDKQMEELDAKLSKMDFSKVQKDIDKAIKNIDFEKINDDVNAALKKVDWDKMNAEISKSIAEVKKVDMTKIKAEIEKAKLELDREKLNINGDKIRADVDKAMKSAKESIEKARVEIGEMKAFTNELDKDGLINKNKPYKIEVKDNELYINGTKQLKEVNDKYRKYFKKGNYTINNNGKDEGVSI